jgi:hypothetical protein
MIMLVGEWVDVYVSRGVGGYEHFIGEGVDEYISR